MSATAWFGKCECCDGTPDSWYPYKEIVVFGGAYHSLTDAEEARAWANGLDWDAIPFPEERPCVFYSWNTVTKVGDFISYTLNYNPGIKGEALKTNPSLASYELYRNQVDFGDDVVDICDCVTLETAPLVVTQESYSSRTVTGKISKDIPAVPSTTGHDRRDSALWAGADQLGNYWADACTGCDFDP